MDIINNMHFIIWGCGARGKRLSNLLGKARIRAFIDNDVMKVGTKYVDIPVISYSEYKEKYSQDIILISVANPTEIQRVLNHDHINWYLATNDLPSEMLYNVSFNFDCISLRKYDKSNKIGLFGINLYSILLYEYLLNCGFKFVKLIQDRETNAAIIHRLPCSIQIADENEIFNNIFVTSSNFYLAASRYKNSYVDDLWDFSYQTRNRNHMKLLQFKDIHNADKLFIIGTGPSLRISDLEVLRKKRVRSMSVNMVYRCFSETHWRPDYYVMGDPFGLEEYGNELCDLSLPVCFVADCWSKLRMKNSYTNFFPYRKIQIFDLRQMRISDDITYGIYARGTVIIECLQIAFYMGFKEIYLLGLDCHYNGTSQSDGNHFVPGYCHEADKQPKMIFDTENVFLSYQLARHYAERHGIKIYNATRGGKLEVFERVDFDSLF